jgi:hypothetical protein
MTTMGETPAAGPVCDICQAEPAVMSEMNLDDYSQVVVGLGCLGGFYAEMAANLKGAAQQDGAETPPAETAALLEAPPEDAGQDETPAGPKRSATGSGPRPGPVRPRNRRAR